MYLDGGTLARLFLEAELVDEPTLTLAPKRSLGAACRSFAGAPPQRHEPLAAVRFPSGRVELRYRLGRDGGEG